MKSFISMYNLVFILTKMFLLQFIKPDVTQTVHCVYF